MSSLKAVCRDVGDLEELDFYVRLSFHLDPRPEDLTFTLSEREFHQQRRKQGEKDEISESANPAPIAQTNPAFTLNRSVSVSLQVGTTIPSRDSQLFVAFTV